MSKPPAPWMADPAALAKGITIAHGGHWWALSVPRKPRTCAHCPAVLMPHTFVYRRRTGKPVHICQPCGRRLRGITA